MVINLIGQPFFLLAAIGQYDAACLTIRLSLPAFPYACGQGKLLADAIGHGGRGPVVDAW